MTLSESVIEGVEETIDHADRLVDLLAVEDALAELRAEGNAFREVAADLLEPTEGAAPPVPVIPTALSELRDEDESVDYSRLNMDVHVVTSTLERFNQKLLRMIAQARASQTGSQPPVSPDAGPTVALDAPNPAPAISGEVSQ